jgi:hypothetical protein
LIDACLTRHTCLTRHAGFTKVPTKRRMRTMASRSRPSSVAKHTRTKPLVSRPNAPHPTARPDSLRIVSLTLQPGEELIVGKRIREVLMEARKNAGA